MVDLFSLHLSMLSRNIDYIKTFLEVLTQWSDSPIFVDRRMMIGAISVALKNDTFKFLSFPLSLKLQVLDP